jgi:hypothetical protein
VTTLERACQMIEAVALHFKDCRCSKLPLPEGGTMTIDARCVTEARKTKIALAHLRSLEEK